MQKLMHASEQLRCCAYIELFQQTHETPFLPHSDRTEKICNEKSTHHLM